MKDYKDFVTEMENVIEARPEHIRKGQAVFNYVDENYGVARDVQFFDRVDCFYNDREINNFISCAYKRINFK